MPQFLRFGNLTSAIIWHVSHNNGDLAMFRQTMINLTDSITQEMLQYVKHGDTTNYIHVYNAIAALRRDVDYVFNTYREQYINDDWTANHNEELRVLLQAKLEDANKIMLAESVNNNIAKGGN